MDAAVKKLATGAFNGGFEAATKWLSEGGFEPSETVTASSLLEFYHTKDDTGKWLDWLGKKLPSDKAGEPISRLMGRWTEVDDQAAGKWLAAEPAGAVKEASIQAYAGTISPYEPETAAEWAMTLAPGKDRDETLKKIYDNWPKDAPGARAAFAKEHGLE